MKKTFLLLAAALVVFGASHISFAANEEATEHSAAAEHASDNAVENADENSVLPDGEEAVEGDDATVTEGDDASPAEGDDVAPAEEEPTTEGGDSAD